MKVFVTVAMVVLGALVLCGTAFSGTAEAQDVRALHDAQLARAIELAEWADEAKFLTGRDGIYEVVLTLDPEHKDARKALGWKKSKGEWKQGKYKTPKDKHEEGVPEEFARMRQAAYAELIAGVDAAFADIEPSPQKSEALRTELAHLLAWSPDDAELRERVGEAWDDFGEEWVLIETITARAMRERLPQLLADLREKIPAPEPTQPDEYTVDMTIEFPVCIASRRVNVTSAASEEETTELLAISHLMRDYFTKSFYGAGTPGYPTVIYVLEGGNLRRAFFSQHALCKPEEVESRAMLTSSWLTGRLVVSAPSPKLRKDVTTFQTCGYALTEKYGVWTEHGWAQQGLCSYLSYNVCGTRLSFWQISEDKYGGFRDKNWTERVPPNTRGWLSEAKRLVDEGLPMSKFVKSISVHTSQMDWQDVVLSHAIAAYMFEARRPELLAILGSLKDRKVPTVTLFERHLDMPVTALRDRVMRWIDEMSRTSEWVAVPADADAPSDPEKDDEGADRQ